MSQDQFQPRRYPLSGLVLNQCKLLAAQAADDAQRAMDGLPRRSPGYIPTPERDRDDAGWFCRKVAVALWAMDTVFPQTVERKVQEIGDRPESRP